MTRTIKFTLNGAPVTAEVKPHHNLVELLQREFNLLGARESCGQGMCGCCTVLVNGTAVSGCLYLAAFVDGAEVEVDTETGHVRILHLINVVDCGRPLNPKIVETQISGASLMQLGFTMFEKMHIDAGQVTNASLAASIAASAASVPKASFSARTKVTSLTPMKPSRVRRWGSWLSNAAAGPSL